MAVGRPCIVRSGKPVPLQLVPGSMSSWSLPTAWITPRSSLSGRIARCTCSCKPCSSSNSGCVCSWQRSRRRFRNSCRRPRNTSQQDRRSANCWRRQECSSMRVTRLKEGVDPWVRLQMSKGVLVVLTFEEYATALYRGKMERRAHRRARHGQLTQAQQDATALAWIPQGDPMTPEMIAPPSAPMLTLAPDPQDDIQDPAVPETLAQTLQEAQHAPHPETPTPAWQQHEALLQGFCQHLQHQITVFLVQETKGLFQTFDAMALTMRDCLAKVTESNEHATYQLANTLAQVQEHGLPLRHDPYVATVSAISQHGFPVTIQVAKQDVSDLISALPALTG